MTTIYTSFQMPGVFLFSVTATLFLTAIRFIQNHMASVGWHRMFSVSWNG
jgi:hypothetical protein